MVALLLKGGALCRPGSHPPCSAQSRAPRLAASASLPLVFKEGAQAEGSTGWGPWRPEGAVHRARPWTPRPGRLVTALGHLLPIKPRQAQGRRRPHAAPVFGSSGGRRQQPSWGRGEFCAEGGGGWGPVMLGSIWEVVPEAAAPGRVLGSERELSRQGRGRGRSVSTGPAGPGARTPTVSPEVREAGPEAREAGRVPGL